MRRERTVVEAEATASEAGVHALAQLSHALRAVCDSQPDHARAAPLGEPSGAIERKLERSDGCCGAGGGGDHIAESLIRCLPEEGEGQVEVLGLHAAERGKRRWQDLKRASREVGRKRDRNEEAHSPDGTSGG